MKTINYKGKGEHSVNELELIIEQQAEELHLFKSGQKQLRIGGVVATLPQDPIILARYLHEAYEMIAKKQNWNTQKNCKVDFSDLPVGNKNTMILLAGKLILDFGGN